MASTGCSCAKSGAVTRKGRGERAAGHLGRARLGSDQNPASVWIRQ